jgi:hypothetical protein
MAGSKAVHCVRQRGRRSPEERILGSDLKLKSEFKGVEVKPESTLMAVPIRNDFGWSRMSRACQSGTGAESTPPLWLTSPSHNTLTNLDTVRIRSST